MFLLFIIFSDVVDSGGHVYFTLLRQVKDHYHLITAQQQSLKLSRRQIWARYVVRNLVTLIFRCWEKCNFCRLGVFCRHSAVVEGLSPPFLQSSRFWRVAKRGVESGTHLGTSANYLRTIRRKMLFWSLGSFHGRCGSVRCGCHVFTHMLIQCQFEMN